MTFLIMNRVNFITACALVIVAATLALRITLRNPMGGPADRVATDQRDSRSPARPPMVGFEAEIPADGIRAKSARREEGDPGSADRAFTVRVSPSHPEAAELGERARLVETHANRQLDELTRDLNLTHRQRERLFPILARGSDSYDPVMLVGGSDAARPALAAVEEEKAVREVLKPDQRGQQVEDAISDAMLWEEIISGLRRELEARSPQVGSDAEAPAEPVPAHPRRNVFELTEPAE